MLKERVITAVVLAPLVIAAIFYLPVQYFSLFIAGVITLGAWEWGPFMGFNSLRSRVSFCAVLAISMLVTHYTVSIDAVWQGAQLSEIYQNGLLAAIAWWCLSLLFVVIYPRGERIWRSHLVAKGIFGFLTLYPAWLALNALRAMEYDTNVFFGAWMICVVLGIVWAADIGAYFSGKSLGKRKLMPKVSPNKTLEGLIGGVIGSVIFVLIVCHYAQVDKSLWLQYSFFTVIVAVASAIGDLNESMLKRDAGIKDSGHILPGHGGILDRIDSLTAAAPVFLVIYTMWVL